MTKQEEIREGVARTFYENSDVSKTITWLDLPTETRDWFFLKADNLLFSLHSQGVVIKVENILPDRCYFNDDNKDMELELSGHTQVDAQGWSYSNRVISGGIK